MRIGLAFLFLSLALPAVSQTKHPFTFEDMMKLKRVEEPVVSPDGKWVLFAAVDVDLKANTKTPHVWVVPLSSAQENAGVAHASPVLARVGGSPKTAGSSTPQDHSQANDPAPVGMTGEGTGASPVQAERSSTEREIISDQDADRPRWAPDGKRFAFVSTKENGSQIWIADFDVATGTVTGKHRLTSIPTEADGELWSPDGKYILFKSDVYPECGGTPDSQAKCNAAKVEETRNSKVKAQIFTHLLYRHWNAYKEGKRTHLFVVEAQPGVIGVQLGGAATETTILARDLTPGDYDAPVFSLGGQDDYAFSPDGKEICYASNHDHDPASSTNNDLWIVPVEGGPVKNITAENKAADNTPLYSPDGKYIAYRAQARPGYESDRFRLMLYDRVAANGVGLMSCQAGTKGCPKIEYLRNLTEDFDRWVGTFAWSPDSLKVFFAAEDRAQQLIFVVDLMPANYSAYASKNVVPWPCCKESIRVLVSSGGGYNDNIAVSPDGTILLTKMRLSMPNFIWKLGKACIRPGPPGQTECVDAGFYPRGIESLNKTVLLTTDMQMPETFWFPGANNHKVQGFLVKPPNFDPNNKYPVKFLIHGGPEGAWGDDWSYRWNPELFAANGYVVIMINFHGSTGYGQNFVDAINGDWGGAPFEDLMKGLDYAEQHYPFIDKDRECALGASYGGYMANWILGHTNRFKCIVSHDGMFNTESAWGDTEELWFNEWEFKGTPWTNREMYGKWSPHLFATNFKTPTLVIHGQKDYRLDVSQGFDLFTTLQRQAVPSKMLYFPDEGHWVLKPQNSQLWYKTVNDWVDEWVGEKK